MMNEIKKLTSLELRSYYGINTFLHTKDKKARRRYILLGVVWIYAIAAVCFYVGWLALGLCRGGLSSILPSYLTVISSVLVLFFGIFKAGHVIFGNRGCDILFSLPVKRSSVVISRFIGMYLEDLLFTLLIFLPGIAVCAYCTSPDAGFYAGIFLSLPFVPVIPLAIATAVGALLSAVSGKMKHRAIAQTVLGVGFIVLIMLGYFGIFSSVENITAEMLLDLAGTLNGIIGKVYAPAVWVSRAAEGNFPWLALLASVSVAMLALLIAAVSALFDTVQRRLSANSAGKNYKMEALHSNGMLSAMLRREAKRYFSSSVYVTNTIVGPIMGVIMSAALVFMGSEKLNTLLAIFGDVKQLIPFAVAAIFTTMTVTSVSISMEGKQFWLVKSLPIPAKVLFDSKILLNLLLILPFYIISQVLLFVALTPTLAELLWLVLIPAVMIVFAVVLGISINLKLARFDWTKEETIVKQSASAALGGFAGLVASIAYGAAVHFSPTDIQLYVKTLGVLVLTALTVVFYLKNNKAKLEEL